MPTMTIPLIPVPFLGSTIFVTDEVSPRVPMRPIVEALGLDWGRQQQKLQSNQKRWSVGMMPTVAGDGKTREMLVIPLRRLWSWLSGITLSRVKPEIRATLARYQAECDEVLEAHWTRHREGLPAPLAKGQEPSGLLFEQVYGRTKAERDAEAERLAAKVVQARAAGAPYRQEASAAEKAMARLGYAKYETNFLIAKVKARLKRGSDQQTLPLLEG